MEKVGERFAVKTRKESQSKGEGDRVLCARTVWKMNVLVGAIKEKTVGRLKKGKIARRPHTWTHQKKEYPRGKGLSDLLKVGSP